MALSIDQNGLLTVPNDPSINGNYIISATDSHGLVATLNIKIEIINLVLPQNIDISLGETNTYLTTLPDNIISEVNIILSDITSHILSS